MAKKGPTTLSVREFLGKYATAIGKAPAAEARRRYPRLAALADVMEEGEYKHPGMFTLGADWDEVAEWWPFRLLCEAAAEGDSEGCKRLLHFVLLSLHVRLPKDVLVPFRWKVGRPKETAEIHEAWIAKGRPVPTWRLCDELAKAFYRDEFAQAQSNPKLRKKLRDRVRATVLRHQLALPATKFAPIS